MNGIESIILNSVIVYFFVIFAIRLFGKKELTQLSIVDLVFILLLSNSVQNAMVGSNATLIGGLAAATSLFIVNWILKNLIFKSKNLSNFLQGHPLMLIYQGKSIDHNLTKAQISNEELKAAIREHGVERIEDVDLAVLENDGNISVLSDKFRKKTVKKRRLHKSLDFTS